MKKVVFGLMALAVLFSACKKDEVEKKDEKETSGLKIEGQWQLKKANFLSEEAYWNDTIAYNEGQYFGHAPSMFELYLGFGFTTDKTEGGEGNKLILYNTRVNLNPEAEYWYWNYKDNNKGFEMMQINDNLPPYNFSILDIKNIEVSNDGKKIVFEGSVYSRIPGKPLMATQMLPVEITMEKGEPTENAEVYILGEEFTH